MSTDASKQLQELIHAELEHPADLTEAQSAAVWARLRAELGPAALQPRRDADAHEPAAERQAALGPGAVPGPRR
jgi:hypothetical protein